MGGVVLFELLNLVDQLLLAARRVARVRVDDLAVLVYDEYLRRVRHVHCAHKLLILVEEHGEVVPTVAFNPSACLCREAAVVGRDCHYAECRLVQPVGHCIVDSVQLADAGLTGNGPERDDDRGFAVNERLCIYDLAFAVFEFYGRQLCQRNVRYRKGDEPNQNFLDELHINLVVLVVALPNLFAPVCVKGGRSLLSLLIVILKRKDNHLFRQMKK